MSELATRSAGERFDLTSLGVDDLYDRYRRLLDEAPVYRSEALSGWYLSRHRFVVESFRDSRLSANRLTPVFEALPETQRRELDPLASSMQRWTLLMDPPDHTRMRTLIAKAFAPKLVEQVEPRVRPLVDHLLTPLLERGEADLVGELAYPLPATVIAAILGVPLSDIDILRRVSDALARFLGIARFDPRAVAETQAAVVEVGEYFRELVAERRRGRGGGEDDDLLGRLIAARDAGDVLDDDELVATLIMLVFAGHETTTHLIANAVLTLSRHPGEAAELRADPDRLPDAVEEVLRYEGPVQRLSRTAAEDFEIGGERIERGQRVFLLVGAANRDPQVFEDPDRFRLGRSDPGRHLGFGWGRHFCVGAALGRLEARLALETLLERAPDLEVQVGPDGPAWKPSTAQRALETLPVRF